MAEPKKPQDHLAKISGNVTVQGIELSVKAESLDDWDVIELVAEVQDAETDEARKLAITVKLLKIILGDEYDDVKVKLRAAHGGRLTSETMTDFVTDLFKAVQNPNS